MSAQFMNISPSKDLSKLQKDEKENILKNSHFPYQQMFPILSAFSKSSDVHDGNVISGRIRDKQFQRMIDHGISFPDVHDVSNRNFCFESWPGMKLPLDWEEVLNPLRELTWEKLTAGVLEMYNVNEGEYVWDVVKDQEVHIHLYIKTFLYKECAKRIPDNLNITVEEFTELIEEVESKSRDEILLSPKLTRRNQFDPSSSISALAGVEKEMSAREIEKALDTFFKSKDITGQLDKAIQTFCARSSEI